MRIVYTESVCKGSGIYQKSTSRGGWAYVIFEDGRNLIKESGPLPAVTHHGIGIISNIEALKRTNLYEDLEVYSNSTIVVDCFSKGWINNWEKNGWLNDNKKPVANKELWMELAELVKNRNITWFKSKFKKDDHYIGMVKRMAEEAVKKI
jgi:ribonuclease HI